MNIENNHTDFMERQSIIELSDVNTELEKQQSPNTCCHSEKKFSSADLWFIQKNRREFKRRTLI